MEKLNLEQRFSLYQTAIQMTQLENQAKIDLVTVGKKFRIMVDEIEGLPVEEHRYH